MPHQGDVAKKLVASPGRDCQGTGSLTWERLPGIWLPHLGEVAKDLVALGVEDHEALVEVVMLHGGGGVQRGQGVAALDLQQGACRG